MKVELRIHTPDDLLILADQDFQAISIGDESCLSRLPGEEEIETYAEAILSRNLSMRFVFPKIEEKDMEYCCRLTEWLLEKYPGTALTLNDLGHIYTMKRLLGEKGFTIGRLLSTSMENWAWGDILLDEEEEWVKKVVTENNMNNALKISFFRSYGAHSMETNLLPFQQKSFSSIQKKGLGIVAHYNYLMLSLCRTCPLKGLSKEQQPACGKGCHIPYMMELSEENESYDEIRDHFPEIVVSGKGIYRRNPHKLEEYSSDCIDTVCMDAHYVRETKSPQGR
jgi:hypothetical protein